MLFYNYIGADFTQKATALNTIVLCSVDCEQITCCSCRFEIPDTICVNSPVTVLNKTKGATHCFWNFGISGVNDTANIYTSSDSIPLPFTYRTTGVIILILSQIKGSQQKPF
jgi:hypothetical protein